MVVALYPLVLAAALLGCAGTQRQLGHGFARATLAAECAIRNHYSAGDSDRPGAFDPRCLAR